MGFVHKLCVGQYETNKNPSICSIDMPIVSGGFQIGGFCLVIDLHRRGFSPTVATLSSVEGTST